jgi:dipeptidyl aminopeptidase/acylaminoacyl peptidase
VWELEKAVSPDGKWLAFYTGSIEEPYDLALNLLNIFDETVLRVENLLALGFPENLEPVTETIEFDQNVEYDKECSADPICRMGAVEIPFKEGIWRFDWSPDSQNIAFAAQIDGSSSDVYIYSLENKVTQRLTNEKENIGLTISWSPDGEKILYESSIPRTVYTSYYLHIANPKIKSLQDPISIGGGTFWARGGWITNNSYILWSGGEGAPPHNFRYINIETQQTKQVWRYVAESFFTDVEKGRIFLLTYPSEISGLEPEPEEGLYLVTFDGNYQKITDDVYIPLDTEGTESAYFAVAPNPNPYDDEFSLFSIGIDGSILDLARRIGFVYPNVSPNKKWAIISSNIGTELFSENLESIKLLDLYPLETFWRPDSLGIFLYKNRELIYLQIPEGEPNQVDSCSLEFCLLKYVWLP